MRCICIQFFGFNESIFRQKTVAVGKIFTLLFGWAHSVMNKIIINPFIYNDLWCFWLVVGGGGGYGMVIAFLRVR